MKTKTRKEKNKMESYKVNLEKVFEALIMIYDDEVSVNAVLDYEINEPERLLVSVIRNMLNLKINYGFITQREVLSLLVELKRLLTGEIKTVDLYTFLLTQSVKNIQVATSILDEINMFVEMIKENEDDEVGGVDNEVS